jgi:hypothetical protein
MPLIEIAGADPAMKKIRMHRRFSELDTPDKKGVVEFLEAGKTGVGAEDIELGDGARDFIKDPDFIDMFNRQTRPPVGPPPNPMAPFIHGLMQIIQQQVRPEPHPKGKLNPEFQERVGGSQKQRSGFQDRLGSAFSSGGATGLAKAHRELFTSDTGYQRFLKEK